MRARKMIVTGERRETLASALRRAEAHRRGSGPRVQPFEAVTFIRNVEEVGFKVFALHVNLPPGGVPVFVVEFERVDPKRRRAVEKVVRAWGMVVIGGSTSLEGVGSSDVAFEFRAVCPGAVKRHFCSDRHCKYRRKK